MSKKPFDVKEQTLLSNEQPGYDPVKGSDETSVKDNIMPIRTAEVLKSS